MAYRPFNRALGETSLELKCLFFFGVALVLVIAVSLLLHWSVTKETVYQQNPISGSLLANEAILLYHLETVLLGPEGRVRSAILRHDQGDGGRPCPAFLQVADHSPAGQRLCPRRVEDAGGADVRFRTGSNGGLCAERVRGTCLAECPLADDCWTMATSISIAPPSPRNNSARVVTSCAPTLTQTLPASASAPAAKTSGVGELMGIAEVTIPNKRTEEALDQVVEHPAGRLDHHRFLGDHRLLRDDPLRDRPAR